MVCSLTSRIRKLCLCRTGDSGGMTAAVKREWATVSVESFFVIECFFSDWSKCRPERMVYSVYLMFLGGDRAMRRIDHRGLGIKGEWDTVFCVSTEIFGSFRRINDSVQMPQRYLFSFNARNLFHCKASHSSSGKILRKEG